MQLHSGLCLCVVWHTVIMHALLSTEISYGFAKKLYKVFKKKLKCVVEKNVRRSQGRPSKTWHDKVKQLTDSGKNKSGLD